MRSRSTGKERDAESGNDYFGARYYASTMGRFLSPDWSDDPDPVPYADYQNPQTLNLYSYGGNNPLASIDSDGHYHCDPDTFNYDPTLSGYVLQAGICHLDWSDVQSYLDLQLRTIKAQLSNAADMASQAAHQFGNIMNTPGGPGCMGGLAAGGASAGATVG